MLYPPNFDDRDKELLTQFVFEKLKAPGFAIMDASLAVLWAYGVSTATVVDVGYEKTDITPVVDFIVQERARTTVSGWGGDSMTKHLAKLLPHMKAEEVEQLKRSPICEILSSGTVLPTAGSVNAAIAAGEKNRKVTDLDNMDLDVEDEDGSFNVAAIVASGKTREFLAKKEKEKRGEFERRLPNREREHNTFWLVEKKKPGEEGVVIIEEPLSAVATTAPLLPLPEKAVEPAAPAPAEPEVPAAEPATATASAAEGEDKPITDAPPAAPAADAAAPAEGAPAAPQEASATAPAAATAAPAEDDAERKNKEKEKRKEERRAAAGGLPPLAEDEQYREVEVGIERFQAAECGILHEIADNLWRVMSRVEDVSTRSELWQSLIVVGNGSKVRGTYPPHPPYIKLTPRRFQGRPPVHHSGKIPHLPLLKHHLHLRASLRPLDPHGHRCVHPQSPKPHGRPLAAQPAPRCGHNPRLAEPVHAAAAPPQRRPRVQPDTDNHQVRQGARVLSRVEGRGLRGGWVLGCAGGRKGPLCG